MFDFNINTPAVNNSKRRLAPWEIYDVTFEGCSVQEFKGKTDPNATYKVLRIRFENEDGYYEESIFFPQNEDSIRPKYQASDGHEYEAPSRWERTKMVIAQLAEVINPEGFKKMQEIASKFRSFDDMCAALIKITDPKKGTKTKLKLLGRVNKNGSVEAVLPRIVGINKEGVLFVSDNFIGNSLYFTPYEEGKRAQYKNAAPTAPADAVDAAQFTEEQPSGIDNPDELLSLL